MDTMNDDAGGEKTRDRIRREQQVPMSTVRLFRFWSQF